MVFGRIHHKQQRSLAEESRESSVDPCKTRFVKVLSPVIPIRCRSALMQNTFDAVEPLPRLYAVDIPVLFGGTTSSDTASAPTERPAAADERERGDGDEQDALFTELDACMRVLENIKPKVGADKSKFEASCCT